MTAKDCFKELAYMQSCIGAKKQRLAALRALASSAGASNLNGMPGSPEKQRSSVEITVCKTVDLEAEIQANEALLQEKNVFLLELIGTIDSSELQTVLIKRYFEHLSWDDIAGSMYCTTRWVYKLHGRALEEMSKKLNKSGYFQKLFSRVQLSSLEDTMGI